MSNGYNEQATNPHGPGRTHVPGPEVSTAPPSRGLSAGAILGLVVIALIVAGVIVWGILLRKHAQSQLVTTTDVAAVQTVTIVHPSAAGTAAEIALPGSTQAYVDTPIYSRTSGYLKAWYFDIGAHVKKGQLMATIETPELDQQLQQAEASLESVQADLNLANTTSARYQALLKTNSVSKQETDVAMAGALSKQAAVDASMANVRRLKQLQSFEKIYAPFSGIVTARNTDIGSLITDGAGAGGTGPNSTRELFHLANASRLRIFVQVPEQYISAIHDGAAAAITFDSYPGQRFNGTIVRNASSIDPTTRTLNVEVDVDNRNGKLLPGAYCIVHFPTPTGGKGLTLPSNTLLFRAQGLQVALVRNGHIHLEHVTIAADHGSTVEIASGLSPDDQIVLDPPDSIAEGQEVRVNQAKTAVAK
jgi:RND family efflux transporter MFP subunit